jgi:hypothetical protein
MKKTTTVGTMLFLSIALCILSSVTLGGTTSTDVSGSFSGATFTVPASMAGGNTVSATDLSLNTASATFTVTGSQFCAVTGGGFEDIDTFRLIFTPDVPTYPSYFRLTASNPGQFSYNVFYITTTGIEIFTISVPYPFVTQGANPVQIYNDAPVDYVPAGTVINSQFSISGTPVTLSSYETGTFEDTTTITITNHGYTGPMYITIHLDYGLKRIAEGYSKEADDNAKANSGKSVAGSILNNQEYAFSVTGAFSGSDSISNVNEFKNDPSIGGLVLNGYGTIANAKVLIY